MAGKKFRAAAEKVDRDRRYALREAVDLAKSIAFAKFDETLEVTMVLGVDPRRERGDPGERKQALVPVEPACLLGIEPEEGDRGQKHDIVVIEDVRRGDQHRCADQRIP